MSAVYLTIIGCDITMPLILPGPYRLTTNFRVALKISSRSVQNGLWIDQKYIRGTLPVQSPRRVKSLATLVSDDWFGW